MAEYGREQRNQLSRAIANSETGSRQLKGFVDNRQNYEYSSNLIIQRSSLTFAQILEQEAANATVLASPPSPNFTFGYDFKYDHLHYENSSQFQIYDNTFKLSPPTSSNGTDYDFSVEMECYRDRIGYAGGATAAAEAPKFRCLTMGYKKKGKANANTYCITHLECQV